MMLYCALGPAKGASCKHYKCGECNRASFAVRINTRITSDECVVTPICNEFEERTRQCDICEDVVSEWHVDNNVLCNACFHLLYIATGSLEANKKALKELVARVKKH